MDGFPNYLEQLYFVFSFLVVSTTLYSFGVFYGLSHHLIAEYLVYF